MEQEKKTGGKWIFKQYGYDRSGVHYPFWDRYTCSVCGKESDDTPYCPYCGSKMENGTEEKKYI